MSSPSPSPRSYAGVKKKKSKQAAAAAAAASPERKTKKGTKKKDENGSSKKIEILGSEEMNIRLGNYQLLEPCGKGGFGIVYRGLNLKNGATVAVKRVNLHGIPKEELEGIEMEIKLLQNLSHSNIVKYIDAIRSDDYLNIVLEFVENGALSNLLSKLIRHGYVEEQLVSVYTYQILEGLKYLHEQGVIHRDIKGANILCTKDGIVKLADFGVATKLNESRKSDSVVGTPYWMAPEIIEMTGQQSSACDIWSVGCTVVELLTGKPPYFDLQQMPALFRIVQDEHPPLPDNISSALEDFLMQCFQKDPLRRISATDLLKHPWLKSAQQNFRDETRLKLIQDAEYRAKITAAEAQTPVAAPAAHVKKPSLADSDLDWDEEEQKDAATAALAGGRLRLMSVAVPASGPGNDLYSDIAAIGSSQIHKFAEKDNEDVSDFEDADDDLEKVTTLAKKKSWEEAAEQDAKSQDDAEDVFADVEFDPPDARNEADAKTTKVFLRTLQLLSNKEDEDNVIKICGKLSEMFTENPTLIRTLMATHAVIPIMEMLEVANLNIVASVLRLVNQVISDDQKFQQSMSLVGLIPTIVKYASPGYPAIIRLEAANFVRHFCYASDFTRKMYIACGGLPVLVHFLEEPYAQSRTLVFNAIDCVRHVFDVTTNPKNDFCRLFCKYGLLPPLAKTFTNVSQDSEHPQAAEYTKKVADIVHLFSQGDAVVKLSLANVAVQEELLRSLSSFPQDVIILILKSIRNISMDPNTLDMLEAAGAIPVLIPFMDTHFPDTIQNQALLALYYLTTIKASRQEQAARSGIIPHLQRFIRNNHQLKQFALPLVFQFAKTSKRTRTELRKHDGVSFFLDLLEETYWKSHALEALSSWLSDPEDAKRVEYKTINHIGKLVSVMKNTKKSEQFDKILGPLEKILQFSSAVNRALGVSTTFIEELLHRLRLHADSNAIRVNLLKMLTLIYDNHQKQEEFASRHALVPLLEELAADKNAVVVANLAQTLLRQIETQQRPDGIARVPSEMDS